MSETKYDTREAVSIAKALRAQKYPHLYSEARKNAAEELCRVVFDVFREAGYTIRTEADGKSKGTYTFVVPNNAASSRIGIVGHEDGINVWMSHLGQESQGQPRILEYDPALELWVGKEPDSSSTPVPGEPLKKRSGVAVVVAHMAEYMKRLP